MPTNLPEIVQTSRFGALCDFPVDTEIAAAEKAKYKAELASIEERLKVTFIYLFLATEPSRLAANYAYRQQLEARAVQVRQALELWTVTLQSPIRRLPQELLSQIFVFSCADDKFDLYAATMTKSSAIPPTSHIIIQVSKYWRDVAKATPQVWNHWVILNSYSNVGAEARLEKFFPRILNLYGRNLTRVYYSTCSTNFLSPLLHTGQYTSLRIAGSVDSMRHVQHALDMPLLEELLIHDHDSVETSPPIVFNTPRLKSLSLYSSADVLSRFSLPWDQITYFSYGPSYPLGTGGKVTPHVLQILEKLPNLTDLHLVGGCVTTQLVPIDSSQFITLSNLRTFGVHGYRLSLLGKHPLLLCLRAPILKRFDLVIPEEWDCDSGLYNHAFRQLGLFLQTSSRLQKLCIAYISGSGCRTVAFTGHPPPNTIHIWGKAPVFRNLFPQVPLHGRIEALDHWHAKALDTRTFSVKDIVSLDRFIDRYLKPEDHSPSREQTTFVIKPVFFKFLQAFCNSLSEFTDDDLDVELYLQEIE